jgi:5,10-methylenetetrahydromethanopterin reductase
VSDVEYGLALPLGAPVARVVDVAAEAERLGYRWLWVNDDRLERDPFTLLAAIAERTEHIRLGPGVTNPYSRHPALLATAIATLDELSGGRAVLGLGAGGTNHRALGIERTAPADTLRDAIELIRALLAGSTATVDGRVVRARDARLDFPARAGIPLYVGSRGPRVLELAGGLADGVIVGNVATRAGWEYATERIAEGARRAGREPEDVKLVAWFYTCVDDDDDRALDAVRPMAATSIVTSRPVLADLGIELPRDFEREMEACDWSLSPPDVERAGQLLPPELVRRFALAGTPETCRRTLRELSEAFPRIEQVTIVPFAPAGGSVAGIARRFIHEVTLETAWR